MTVQEESVSNELSIREVFLLLRKWSIRIIGFSVVLALIVFVVSRLLPETYTSRVVVSLGVLTQNQQNLLSNLPSASGLAQGFVDLQNTTLLAKDLGVDDPTQNYQARFDVQRGLLNLTAQGRTPEEARDRAERILKVARDYLLTRMVEGAQSNIKAALIQTQLDLQVARDGLNRIQNQLKAAPDRVGTTPTTTAGLEARGSDPQAARSSNPGITSLSLEESRLKAQIAQLEAREDSLSKFLKNPAAIGQLVGQVLLVQELVPPAQPLRPSFPKPMLFSAIAGVLGFVASILWAFIAEAIRPREPRENISSQ